MKHTTKALVCLLLAVLLAAAVLTGCAQNDPPSTEAPKPDTTAAPKPETTAAPETKTEPASVGTTAAEQGEPVELGEGDKLFYFNVSFSDGETASYAIHTDAETVGEALLALELIAGDESQYGLYVKTVGEETLDYETDGKYWAFYENGEYAMTGVDSTVITEGATYSFAPAEG